MNDSPRIVFIGDDDQSRSLAIALSRAVGAQVVLATHASERITVIEREPSHTQTLAEALAGFVVEPEPAPAPAMNRAQRRGQKSEAFYARRDQMARNGGKR